MIKWYKNNGSPFDVFSLGPLFFVTVIYFLFLIMQEIFDYYDKTLVVLFILIISFIFFGIRSIYCLFKREFWRFVSHASACMALIIISNNQSTIRDYLDILRLNIFADRYGKCMQSASNIESGAAFAVCDTYRGDRGEFVKVFLYDSSDEAGLPPEHQSSAWVKNALAIDPVKAPFGLIGFKATRISGHFYEVIFSVEYPESPYSRPPPPISPRSPYFRPPDPISRPPP